MFSYFFNVPFGKLYMPHSSLAVTAACFGFTSISVKQSESHSPTLSSGIFPGAHTGEVHDL